MNLPIIQLEQLSKRYHEADRERIVLEEADALFIEGEFTVLLGRSGSGKSTLLNLISGIDLPDAGKIKIDGNDVTALKERDRTLFRRQHIGIIFQSFNLIPTLTVLENITLPFELQGKTKRVADKHAKALLERVGLADRLKTYPDRLSGGQQQRVAIARALVHEPRLILADEPTGNLDRETGDQILELLLEMTREAGKTLIMATHSMEVISLADRVFRVADGKLIDDTYHLRIGAAQRARLESHMHARVEDGMIIAEVEA